MTTTPNETYLAGFQQLGMMQRCLARIEACAPYDWEQVSLKINLRNALRLQSELEGRPKRHEKLIATPEYQLTVAKLAQLRREYSLWLTRNTGLRYNTSVIVERLAESYVMTARNLRTTVFYLECFSSRPTQLIGHLLSPEFQAHQITLLGVGTPSRWVYIEGLNKDRQELKKEIQAASEWMLLP